jgi:hypothetical protein
MWLDLSFAGTRLGTFVVQVTVRLLHPLTQPIPEFLFMLCQQAFHLALVAPSPSGGNLVAEPLRGALLFI